MRPHHASMLNAPQLLYKEEIKFVSFANDKKHLRNMLASHEESFRSQLPTAKHDKNLKQVFCSALFYRGKVRLSNEVRLNAIALLCWL